MDAKSCSRSQGQPVPGVRSLAMISSRREISREGVIMHQAWNSSGLYDARRLYIPAERGLGAALSTDWRDHPGGAKCLSMTDGPLSETALVLFSGGQDS